MKIRTKDACIAPTVIAIITLRKRAIVPAPRSYAACSTGLGIAYTAAEINRKAMGSCFHT